MDDDLYNDINTLLSLMRGSPGASVPQLVDNYYLKGFYNSVPGELLRIQIDKLQARLDASRKENKMEQQTNTEQVIQAFNDCLAEGKTVSTFIATPNGVIRANFRFMPNEELDKAWGITKAQVFREVSQINNRDGDNSGK